VTRRARLTVMGVAVAALLAFYVRSAAGLPDFGHYRGPYGTEINHVVSAERVMSNSVTALVFDYRGFDTLGEELILFISVVGVVALAREARGEEPEVAPEAARAESHPRGSDAVRLVGIVASALTLLLGLYVVAHGNLTPGGGFQGGVILGAALLVLYSAGAFPSLRRLEPQGWMDLMHSAGAAGLAALALGGLIGGGAFFHNFLWTGHPGDLTAGGIIPLGNASVGLEVFGATLVLASEFVQEAVLTTRSDV